MIDKVLCHMVDKAAAFFAALALTLVLTPVVREINRAVGMVDKPDPRRINKKPIPRGGGVALFIGVMVAFYSCACAFSSWGAGGTPFGVCGSIRLGVLSLAVLLIGLADDRFSLPPKLKLLGQVLVAAAVWWWGGLGFARLWPSLPAWLDCLVTVFWITGAINAFNLIDGLDGLASGLALIATVGMAGSLFMLGMDGQTLLHFALAGGLLGFLRYNYNPASVFLGDSGSMFIGFMVSVLPLLFFSPDSFLVSVGIPLLAMGVPIFDTSLAILRRLIRRLLLSRKGDGASAGEVMAADSDHLHHRILRSVGLNQRKAAWILYLMAASVVAVGLVNISLSSRAAGLWLLTFAAASVVIFRDMARVELFDAGRLLNEIAHDSAVASRRRWARMAVPFYVVFDLTALTVIFVVNASLYRLPPEIGFYRAALPVYLVSVFLFLVFFRAYRTVWSRAVTSNYMRLLFACLAGTVCATGIVYYVRDIDILRVGAFALVYAPCVAIALISVRLLRGFVRDLFYSLDCQRLRRRKDVSRILVYGAGLRYRAFRRELVRRTSANERIIVGLLDDNLLLRGQYIGGVPILGTIQQVASIVNEVNADQVVIACSVSPEWLKVVRQLLEPTGVRVTVFSFSELPLD